MAGKASLPADTAQRSLDAYFAPAERPTFQGARPLMRMNAAEREPLKSRPQQVQYPARE